MTSNPQPGERSALWRCLPAWREPGRQPSSRLADGVLFACATALGGFTLGSLWHTYGEVAAWADVVFGAIACLALWWRRSYPMAVFVLSFAAAAISPLGLGAGLVAICTAASRARRRDLMAIVVIAVPASVVFPLVNPQATEILQIGFPAFLFSVSAFGWGLYLRARRELIASLRERAERLEADQQHSAEEAREAERRRIAWEMHDVLAHRLSLLSLHAGAMEFHPDAPADEIAQAASVIRSAATAALGELRQVITVLREDSVALDAPPQPSFGRLADLLEESRSAGMNLTEHIDLPEAGDLPARLGRTAYRVVQEGLTNARKHAPGAPVKVAVTTKGEAVMAEVVSRRVDASAGLAAIAPAVAGAGAGLIGLAERVTLAGGRLEYGPNAIGDFVLRATIPRQP